MRALILSDIHGNLEALEAVLADAEGQWDELWNLGDTVGYGASPNQVVERMRALAAVHVRGNHDRVCCGLTSPRDFNPVAKSAALWTRAQLSRENLAWLEAMPHGPIVAGGGAASCAHGSPLHEDVYLLSIEDAVLPLERMETAITFFGHTHVQGGFAQMGGEWQELKPCFPRGASANGAAAVPQRVELPQESRALINPGSVGQPRDRDWRAAYAIFETGTGEQGRKSESVTFHRVPYDLQACQAKIRKAGLPDRLAARLAEGR